ncbi:hypothetical protein SANA_22580 [Gottschalkiaceae bacterium SANA]|nr:hypothetical protein SANA_22580 [Gottschalkiaceae bacterium SANA]
MGLLQCNDLFSLFVFIEITTILSTILIIYEKNGYAIKSGIYYLLFNSVGMLFYQLGFIFLYTTMGTLNMTLLTERLAVVPHSSILRLANLFFLVAICVKSAIFPVYNWLPRAHSAAPSAISALLSGLLVKSGIYAFIRIQALFGLTFMNSFFFSLGLLSAVSGMIFALSQKDLKQILAYSTVSQIGLIVMGLSQPNTMMYLGGITHLVNHSLIKSLLFLCAGVIIHHTGKRKITEIRGIFKTMPLLSIAMIVGMVSITGGFLTNGYLSKSLLVYGLQKQGITARLVYEVINLGTITYFMKIAQIFFGPPCTKPQKIVLGQRVAISLLASICLIIPWFYSSIWGFFGLDLPTLTLFSWSKFFLLSFQVAIGFVCLKWMMNQEPKFMSTIRHFQLSFGASNGLMLFFLILMIAAADLL